jgi:hypothetical protein
MKTNSYFRSSKLIILFSSFFVLFGIYCYAKYQWNRPLGFWPMIRQYCESLGAAYPLSIQIADSTRYLGSLLLKILSGLVVSFLVWIFTTHKLTKNVQFSSNIFEEKNDEKRTYRVAIRNSEGPSWIPKHLDEMSLFRVFDVTIYGRMKIGFQKCINQNSSEYQPRRQRQMSLKLNVVESYHAIIDSDSKRLLNIEISNVDEKIKRLRENSCKCPVTSQCQIEHQSQLKTLDKFLCGSDNSADFLQNRIGLLEIMKTYDDCHIELVAMVTGKTTLRKKPISSKKFELGDFLPIGEYYSIPKYNSYE